MSYFNITIAMCTNNISLLKFESCEALKRHTEITIIRITCNPANQIRLPFFGSNAYNNNDRTRQLVNRINSNYTIT